MQYTERLIATLRQNPQWKVLDVGGGEQPCVYANEIIDVYPWPLAERQGCIGNPDENRLSNHSFIQHDINSIPWPNYRREIIPDKYYDFVICSNVLEDIRDPISVCREMSRIGKAGMVEYPSPLTEMSRSADNAHPDHDMYPGYFHHRWFVEFRDDKLVFLCKNMRSIMHGTVVDCSESKQVWWVNSLPAVESLCLTRVDYDTVLGDLIKREEMAYASRMERQTNTCSTPR